MVTTIIPIGNGDTHQTQYRKRPAVVLVHALGTTIAAAAFGMIAGAIGMVLKAKLVLPEHEQLLVLITGGLALLYAGHEFKFFRLPAPQSGWQVPEKWKSELSPIWSSFLYGAGLGTGLLTAIPSATFYLVLVWVLVTASPWFGLLCFTMYGIGRAAPIVLMFYLSGENKEVCRLSRQTNFWQPVVHIFSGLALCVMGTCLIAGALSALD
jgi:cytochrome c biogenesis protein CcdA